MGARNLARKEMFRKLWCFLAACCFLSHPSIVWCSVVVDVVATKAVKKKAKENICILCSSSIFSALLYILTTISVKLCHPLPPPRKRRQTSPLGFQWRPECYRCARKHTGVLCPISAFIFFLRIPTFPPLPQPVHCHNSGDIPAHLGTQKRKIAFLRWHAANTTPGDAFSFAGTTRWVFCLPLLTDK